MKLMLDTNVLGMILHSSKHAHQDVKEWFARLLAKDDPDEIFLPEIADYELRRELIRMKSASIPALDRLAGTLSYHPISTTVMRKAADLWAKARSEGRPTAAKEALDGDVILAAEALDVGATVVTENPSDFERVVNVRRWADVS